MRGIGFYLASGLISLPVVTHSQTIEGLQRPAPIQDYDALSGSLHDGRFYWLETFLQNHPQAEMEWREGELRWLLTFLKSL